MNLKFCPQHEHELVRALTSRGLSEIGWTSESERKQAIAEQMTGRYTRKNFNPFIRARIEIWSIVGDMLGDKAEGCPVCLLGETDIVQKTAERMLAISQSLPDE